MVEGADEGAGGAVNVRDEEAADAIGVAGNEMDVDKAGAAESNVVAEWSWLPMEPPVVEERETVGVVEGATLCDAAAVECGEEVAVAMGVVKDGIGADKAGAAESNVVAEWS